MAVSSFSPLTPRWCGWCQQPVQGRADKLFCGAACRGKAARYGVVGGAPIDWQARAEQAEQTVQTLQAQFDQLAHARQAVAPLERRYDEFTQVLNVMVPELSSLGMLTGLLEYVEGLLADYEQHPGVAQGEAGPHFRVQILQQLRGTIQRQMSYVALAKPVAPIGATGEE